MINAPVYVSFQVGLVFMIRVPFWLLCWHLFPQFGSVLETFCLVRALFCNIFASCWLYIGGGLRPRSCNYARFWTASTTRHFNTTRQLNTTRPSNNTRPSKKLNRLTVQDLLTILGAITIVK